MMVGLKNSKNYKYDVVFYENREKMLTRINSDNGFKYSIDEI